MSSLKFSQQVGGKKDAPHEDSRKPDQEVTNAEAAIFERLQELFDNNQGYHEERPTLSDALSGLQVLNSHRLGFWRTTFFRYVVALALTALALLGRWLLDPFLGN